MELWKHPGTWFGRPAAGAARARPTAAPAWLTGKGLPSASAAAAAADEPAPVCGWFDSSLDLRDGLFVTEHYDVNLALAIEVALDWSGPATAAALPTGPGLELLPLQARRPARKSSTA